MVDYSLFQLACPPRTGTTWMLHAAAIAGLGSRSKAAAHQPHNGQSRGLRVCTVRHPCTWLASYWTVLYPGFTGVDIVDRFAKLRGDTFDQFVRSYLSRIPGAIGEMFFSYNADSYVRLEDLPWSFVDLLASSGVPQSMRERCISITRMNSGISPKPDWNKVLHRRVIESERDMCDLFDYWD